MAMKIQFLKILSCIYDEYRRKETLEGRIQKKKKNLDVYDHQIHRTLATDDNEVSFDGQ